MIILDETKEILWLFDLKKYLIEFSYFYLYEFLIKGAADISPIFLTIKCTVQENLGKW